MSVAREGLVALALEVLFPGAEQGLPDVQGAGGLRHGVALLGDQFDRLDLELARVAASLSRHGGPPTVSIHRYLGVHHSWGGSVPPSRDGAALHLLVIGMGEAVGETD